MLIFPNWYPSYIPPWLEHLSMNFTAYFEFKTLTKFTLKCTSHGGMYGKRRHQFRGISIMSKQWITPWSVIHSVLLPLMITMKIIIIIIIIIAMFKRKTPAEKKKKQTFKTSPQSQTLMFLNLLGVPRWHIFPWRWCLLHTQRETVPQLQFQCFDIPLTIYALTKLHPIVLWQPHLFPVHNLHRKYSKVLFVVNYKIVHCSAISLVIHYLLRFKIT